jgi:dTDP-4-dehydrorhamnose reductase
MKYLIFGSKGQLGKEIINLLESKNVELLGYDLPECDISNFLEISQIMHAEKPEIVINCAAFNNVDLAEIEFEDAYKTNALGVENLVSICKRENAKFVHFSSDYVFDGNRNISGLNNSSLNIDNLNLTELGLYNENDIPNPINSYGKTKLDSEIFIAKEYPEALVFRTSWLYGEGEQNFIFKLQKWAESSKYLKISDDEFSVPTSTRLVAEIVYQAINNNLTGLFHLTCTGYASRFEWAKLIFELEKKYNNSPYKQLKNETILYPAKSQDFNLLAKRPAFSAMDNSKIAEKLQIEIPHWKNELELFFKNRYSDKNKSHNFRKLRNETGIIEY